MCGIAGIVGYKEARTVMPLMLDDMAHRGPDSSGVWSGNGKITLGHTRLAIIDHSDSANQPFESPDGRYILSYNGEIYNYIELRPELENRGWVFRSQSDTEVLMAGLVLEGISFIEETIGMFAFAFYDSKEDRLILARDRVGIKPLFYAEPSPGKLVFASELKSVLRIPSINRELDPVALDHFFTFRYTPGPRTMVKDVSKFPAGHWGIYEKGKLVLTKYWEASFRPELDYLSKQEASEKFEGLLSDAVRLRLRGDVPYGAFLSGGVDSATILSLMSKHASQKFRTYSIGFGEEIDEIKEAEQVSGKFGVDHTSFLMTPEDLRRLPDVAWHMDEPYADPIALATYLLSKRASEDGVKVILTGEGADELQAGYVHHRNLETFAKYAGSIPGFILKLGAVMASKTPVSLLDNFFNYPVSMGSGGRDRFAHLLRLGKNPVSRYLSYISLLTPRERAALYSDSFIEKLDPGQGSESLVDSSFRQSGNNGRLADILTLEYRTWLQDNILFKQDKTLMAFSIEGRVPYCDHRLVEFASALPVTHMFGEHTNKSTLRSVATRLLPSEIIKLTNQKKAFLVPLNNKYFDTMSEIAHDILKSASFRGRNVFEDKTVKSILDGFSASSFLAGKQIMAVVMFELWAREVLDRAH